MIELGLHLLELLELLLEIDVEEPSDRIRSRAIESGKVIRKRRSSIEDVVYPKGESCASEQSAPSPT
jgi:hypothetical protein